MLRNERSDATLCVRIKSIDHSILGRTPYRRVPLIGQPTAAAAAATSNTLVATALMVDWLATQHHQQRVRDRLRPQWIDIVELLQQPDNTVQNHRSSVDRQCNGEETQKTMNCVTADYASHRVWLERWISAVCCQLQVVLVDKDGLVNRLVARLQLIPASRRLP